MIDDVDCYARWVRGGSQAPNDSLLQTTQAQMPFKPFSGPALSQAPDS